MRDLLQLLASEFCVLVRDLRVRDNVHVFASVFVCLCGACELTCTSTTCGEAGLSSTRPVHFPPVPCSQWLAVTPAITSDAKIPAQKAFIYQKIVTICTSLRFQSGRETVRTSGRADWVRVCDGPVFLKTFGTVREK